MPAAIIGRSSGTKTSGIFLRRLPACTSTWPSPGEAGGVSGSSAWPPSTKICVPGSAGDRSSSCHWPIVAFNVTWVRAVTGTPSRSVRRRRNLAGVRPSAMGRSGALSSMRASLPGAITLTDALPRALPMPSSCSTWMRLTPGRRFTPTYSQPCTPWSCSWLFLPTRSWPTSAPLTLRRKTAPRRPLTMMEVWAMGRVWPSFRLSRPSSGSASGSSSSSGRAVAASGAPAAFAASVRVARGAGDFPSRPGLVGAGRAALRVHVAGLRAAAHVGGFHELRLRLEVAAHAGGGFVALGRGGVAAREHFLPHRRRAGLFDEIGLVQLALLQVDEAGAGLAGADGGRGLLVDAVAVAGRTQHRALRQGGQVELEHVRQRTQAVEAVFALAVGDGEGAVFQVQAHAGDADFAGFLVLDAIAVAVQRDLANDEGLFREHAADHFHPRRGFVRAQRAAGGAGAVDAVALQGADVHAHAIGQAQRFLVGQAQRRQLEAHRQPALPLGVSSGSTALAPAAVMTRAEPCW